MSSSNIKVVGHAAVPVAKAAPAAKAVPASAIQAAPAAKAVPASAIQAAPAAKAPPSPHQAPTAQAGPEGTFSAPTGPEAVLDIPKIDREVLAKAMEAIMALPQVAKEPEVNKIFRLTLSLDASDLHLKEGQPPMMRIRGDIVRLDMKPLTQEDMERLLGRRCRRSPCNPADRRRFPPVQDGTASMPAAGE